MCDFAWHSSGFLHINGKLSLLLETLSYHFLFILGRRDFRGSDLRDRLDRRHSPQRRYSPERDVRGRQELCGREQLHERGKYGFGFSFPCLFKAYIMNLSCIYEVKDIKMLSYQGCCSWLSHTVLFLVSTRFSSIVYSSFMPVCHK